LIEGVVHVFKLGEGSLHVIFTSEFGTGKHAVSSKEQAEQFISTTLRRPLAPGDIDRLLAGEPVDIRANITEQEYNLYF
jgi:hypothetical protein